MVAERPVKSIAGRTLQGDRERVEVRNLKGDWGGKDRVIILKHWCQK